jgi:phage tail tube protein FII
MLFDKPNQKKSIDTSIFKIPVNEARLFECDKNNYVITEFDVSAVANYYNTDNIQAFEKILEEYNLNVDQVELICEANEFYSSRQIELKIKELELALDHAKRDQNITRIKIIENSLSKYRQQLIKTKIDEKEKSEQKSA